MCLKTFLFRGKNKETGTINELIKSKCLTHLFEEIITFFDILSNYKQKAFAAANAFLYNKVS